MIRRPPKPPLFPYTTLFRSELDERSIHSYRHVVRGTRDQSSATGWYGGESGAVEELEFKLAGFPTIPSSGAGLIAGTDRKSTRLNSSHQIISYAVFCLKQYS